MVPDGWILSTVGEHAEVLTGYPFQSSDYTSDEGCIRLLRGDNVGQGVVRWRDVKRWGDYQSSLGRYQLKPGDFVIAMDRTWITGGLRVAEIAPKDVPSLLVQRVARLRSRPSLDQRLLKQHFSGHRFEQYVKGVQTQTAVPHISPNDLRSYPLPLPPLHEQKKIAEILSTWDKAIETTEKLVANAGRQKRALMEQLLTGKRRLRGGGGKWKEFRLDHLAHINPRAGPRGKGPVTFLPMEAVSNEGQILNAYVRNSETLPGGYTAFIEGDVLVAKITPCFENGKGCHAVGLISGRGLGSTEFHVVRAKLPSDQRLLFHVTNSRQFRQLGEANMTGSAGQRRVPAGYIESYKLSVPENPEARLSISSVLDEADALLMAQRLDLANLVSQKRALMQQLLTGKRRVSV